QGAGNRGLSQRKPKNNQTTGETIMATTFEQWAKKVIASGVLSLAVCHPVFAKGFGGAGAHMSAAPARAMSMNRARNVSQIHAASHLHSVTGVAKGIGATATHSGTAGSSQVQKLLQNGSIFKQPGGAGSTGATITSGGNVGNIYNNAV